MLAECDRELERMLEQLARHDGDPGKPKRRGRQKNAPRFDVRVRLFRVCGVDLTRIDGIDTTTALKVLSETGPDLSRFPTAKHFSSWLNLCPATRITGGKRLKGREHKRFNRAGQALRQAAVGLSTSKSALGACFRRMAGRLGMAVAVKATAHKLARLVSAGPQPRAWYTWTGAWRRSRNATACAPSNTSPSAPQPSAPASRPLSKEQNKIL